MARMKELYIEVLEAAIEYRENDLSFIDFVKDHNINDISLSAQLWREAREYMEV